MHLSWFSRCSLVVVVALAVGGAARAELSKNQARNVIRRMAGAELPGSAVRVKSVSTAANGAAEVTADIKTVFRFEKSKEGVWRIAEVRTGPELWLSIGDIAKAANGALTLDECRAPDPPTKRGVDPSVKRARCLVANLVGVTLPSDAVRIQQVSPLGVPFASEPSAIVEALVEVNARIANDRGKGWHVTEIRTGNNSWVPIDALVASLDTSKVQRTRDELQKLAEALEHYRRDRGTFVVADNQAVLIDHISPKYLLPVLRLDPWNQPYLYQGERDRFTLSSSGPDRKSKTADDITLSH